MPNNKMERFTQRARRVLSLAQEEAEQLRHSYIGTEHLLMGLLREEGGIAGLVLRDLGLEEQRVREMVESLSPANDRYPRTSAELSPGTKRVLEIAVDEARRMGHNYIGTEHLLLGLVRQSDGVAVDVLKRLGISPEEVRRQTRRALQEQPVQRAEPRQPAPVPPRLHESIHFSESFLLATAMLMQLLNMVSENKLTMSQATELFSAVAPDIHLTADDNARLIGQFFRPDLLADHQVHFAVTDMETNTVQATWESSLETVMRSIDRFIGAVLLPKLSKEVTFTEGDIRIVVRIEKNAATQPPPPVNDEKE